MTSILSAVSVIIPTYNRAQLVVRAIKSVLAQLRADDEVLIIDDGSTDDTSAVVAQFGAVVRYIKTANAGAGAARNRGLDEATRPFVTFLDSDDEWLPNHLELLRQVMSARPELLYCFTNFRTEFRDGSTQPFALETQEHRELDWNQIVGVARLLSTTIQLPDNVADCPCHECDNLYVSQLRTNYMSVDTLMVRRSLSNPRIRFAEDTSTAEEWEFTSRFAGSGRGGYLHCESVLVHQHSGRQLTDLDMLELATSRITILQRVWGADPEFLARHGDYYFQRLREEREYRAGRLILRGETAAARAELKKLESPPASLYLLSRLPGGVAKGLLDLRRAIRLLLKRKGHPPGE